jgi:hypothetical protein
MGTFMPGFVGSPPITSLGCSGEACTACGAARGIAAAAINADAKPARTTFLDTLLGAITSQSVLNRHRLRRR